MPRRCTLGCPPLGVPTHQLPHPERCPDTFKAWVKIVGGKLESPSDYEHYRKKIICDIHFTQKDKNRYNRLNAVAVPTLHLKASATVAVASVPVNDPLLMDTQPSTSTQIMEASGTVAVASVPVNDPLPMDTQPSTSTQIMEASAMVAVTSVPVNDPLPMDTQPSTLTQIIEASATVAVASVPVNDPLLMDTQPSTSTQIIEDEPICGTRVLLEHNYMKREFLKKYRHFNLFPRKKVPILVVRRMRAQERQIRTLNFKIKTLKKQAKSFKARLSSAEKINDDVAFRLVTRNMTTPAKLFTRMQFAQSRKKPSGRRFTLEEKILSLSLFKRSRKCYKLLLDRFTLPSARTLSKLLARIKLGSGLIDIVFEKLKDTLQELQPEDKLYSLLFDEMALSPEIHYDCGRDKLYGFSDFDNKKIADHVLVFMIKGVKSKIKQPVAYYFTSSINKYDLKKVIKDVIAKLQATGLTIVSTICDQGTANVGAINELVQESKDIYFRKGMAWRHDFFEVGKQEIIPLYDVPHLLKGIRNNLLTKDLMYVDMDGKQKIVKWDYFRQVYEADKSLGELTLLNKITEEHLNPEIMKKMRVKLAAQVFSHSMAVVTEHLAARGIIREECRQLIPMVLMIDNLFDSLNSSSFHIPNGKIFKGCVKKKSPHHQLWSDAIKILKSMKFITKKLTTSSKIRIVESTTPTIKNFIKTIQGFQVLWKVLSEKYSLDSMMTRNFNQDPLENFFGNIRSYGVRNVSPNCISFESSYKALLINNYNSPHSVNANCEKDDDVSLQNFSFFFKSDNKKEVDIPEEEGVDVTEDMLHGNKEDADSGVRNYVSGWVLKKCLTKIIKGCKKCKDRLVCQTESEKNEYIRRKEYQKNKKWLVYPSEECEKSFHEIQDIAVGVLKKNVPKENLKKTMRKIVRTLVYFPCTCEIHYEKLREYFENLTMNVIIYSWCRSINRILAGKIKYSGDDEVKNAAQIYNSKHKHKK